MIAESGPWKEQLLRDAGKLRRLGSTKLNIENCDRELVQLERLVFVTAYAMRKLWEAEKLSTDWNAQRLPCLRFPLKGDVPDRLNRQDIDKHYDLSAATSVNLKPEEYCDRIIHSFIFAPVVGDEETIESFYFTSDRMRKHAIWLVELDKVIELVRRTGKDYPSSGHWIRGADGQLLTWSGHGDPPEGWVKAAEAKKIRK